MHINDIYPSELELKETMESPNIRARVKGNYGISKHQS